MAEQISQAPKIRTSMQMSRASIEALRIEQAAKNSSKPASDLPQIREFSERKQEKKKLTIPQFSFVNEHNEGQSIGGKSPRGAKNPGGKSPVSKSPVFQSAGTKIVSFAHTLQPAPSCKLTSPRSAYSTKPLAFTDAVDTWTNAERLLSKQSRRMSTQVSHVTFTDEPKPSAPVEKETVHLPENIIPVVLKTVDSFELDDSEESSDGEKFHPKPLKGKRSSVPEVHIGQPCTMHDVLARYMQETASVLGATASKRRSSDTTSTYV